MFDEFGNPVDAYDTNYGPNESWGGGSGDDFADGGGGLLPVQFGGLGGIAGRAGSLIGGGARAMGSGAMALGRRAAGYIMTASGRKIATGKAWEIAKKYGPEVAAAAVGMSIVDFLAIMMDSGAMTRRRRRRGISNRDIRTTRRVVNFVNHLTHTLGCVSSPRRHFRRGGSSAASASARAR